MTTSVSPPQGFVADHQSLSTDVNTDLKAVQFTITNVGSKWVDTVVTHDLKHQGKSEKIRSKIGVKTRSDHGLGDLEAGFRYQYLRTRDWRLAFTGGVRFPTGEVDDPDDLVDYGVGNGAYSLLFQFNNDWVISNLWRATPAPASAAFGPGPGELILRHRTCPARHAHVGRVARAPAVG